MEVSHYKTGTVLVVTVRGRLDASWADFFTDTFLDFIRQGNHHLAIEASDLVFLSSAGIRSLLRIHKELLKVDGWLRLFGSNEFVAGTLGAVGFGLWLADGVPPGRETEESSESGQGEVFVLDPSASVICREQGSWSVFDSRSLPDSPMEVRFSKDSFGLGIGSPFTGSEITVPYGDFLAIDGHVVCGLGDDRSRPDYLIPTGDFVPGLSVVQAQILKGPMACLYRFSPDSGLESFSLSTLTQKALEMCSGHYALVVLMAEIDGLVGARLSGIPGGYDPSDTGAWRGMRDWLAFSGERVYAHELVLAVGVVRLNDGAVHSLLRPVHSKPELLAHLHAAVFPFQPLPNGKLDLTEQVSRLFGGPPPKALLHLLGDDRPGTGIGESAFYRGALWASPIAEGRDKP